MKLTHFVIPGGGRLDPITVIAEDHEPGKGRLYVHVFGCAWSAWWGAMGGRSVLDFVAGCDADYVLSNLIRGRGQWITSNTARKREETYLRQICEVVCVEAAKRGVAA